MADPNYEFVTLGVLKETREALDQPGTPEEVLAAAMIVFFKGMLDQVIEDLEAEL